MCPTKGLLTSFLTREMQNKTIGWFHFTITRKANILARVWEYQALARVWSNDDPPSLLGGVTFGGSLVSGEIEVPALLEKCIYIYTWNLIRMVTSRWVKTASTWQSTQMSLTMEYILYLSCHDIPYSSRNEHNLQVHMDKPCSQNLSDGSKSQRACKDWIFYI